MNLFVCGGVKNTNILRYYARRVIVKEMVRIKLKE